MRKINRYYTLNEARVQRTIDPKIWATMSSTTSKNRATLAEDNKPKSTDPKDVILQKYVAGLLTMGVACPNNAQDITALKAYKNFGIAYLNMGGTIQEIQKLYVENGGTLTASATPTAQPAPQPEPDDDDTPDYPDYDDVDVDDDVDDDYEDKPVPARNMRFDSDDDDDDLDVEDMSSKDDYPDYDDVDDDDYEDKPVARQKQQRQKPNFDKSLMDLFSIEDPMDKLPFGKPQKAPVFKQKRSLLKRDRYSDLNIDGDFNEKVNDEKKLNIYFKTLGSQFYGISAGDSLVYSEDEGLTFSPDKAGRIMRCVIRKGGCIDQKARFMYNTHQRVALGFVGNDEKFDDLYYKIKTQSRSNDVITSIVAGSAYAHSDEENSFRHTKMLKELGNKPANAIDNIELPNLEETSDMFENAFKQSLYIPSLLELSKASKYLQPGRYWSSSVTNGMNLVFEKTNEGRIKVNKVNSPAYVATLVVFAKF